MKELVRITIYILILLIHLNTTLFGQYELHKYDHSMKINLIVDAACAKCQFGYTKDDKCYLAVDINSEIYYVDGTTIEEHKDKTGFCNVIRKAHTQGIIKDNRFLLEKFSVLKYQPKKFLYKK